MLFRLGVTNKELAEFLEISVFSFYKFKLEKRVFGVLKKGITQKKKILSFSEVYKKESQKGKISLKNAIKNNKANPL